MASLRQTCESIGCTDVATYIQSGNVVLTSPLSASGLRVALEKAISEGLGVPAAVLLRTSAELSKVISGNPFPDADARSIHVAFLTGKLDRAAAAAVPGLEFPPDELALRGAHVYLHLPNGMGRSKLAVALERRLPVAMTLRNWRTVTKLGEMLKT
jgi:uncharacterized protein (DUF1697 family)